MDVSPVWDRALLLSSKYLMSTYWTLGFFGGPEGKESACNSGDLGLVPGLGRSSGEGNGNPLQYSCLENSVNRGAWQAIVHGVAKSQTWLSHSHTHCTLLSLALLLSLPLLWPQRDRHAVPSHIAHWSHLQPPPPLSPLLQGPMWPSTEARVSVSPGTEAGRPHWCEKSQ